MTYIMTCLIVMWLLLYETNFSNHLKSSKQQIISCAISELSYIHVHTCSVVILMFATSAYIFFMLSFCILTICAERVNCSVATISMCPFSDLTIDPVLPDKCSVPAGASTINCSSPCALISCVTTSPSNVTPCGPPACSRDE